jgi:signal transduction histidine kinase
MPEPRTSGAQRDRSTAILAHEIRGSLTAISGYAELLARPLSEEDRERALIGIQRAVRRIDALLSTSASSEPAGPAKERLSLDAVAERVVADARAISGRDIALDAQGGADAVGSSDALERALANLVDNALKYSPADSEVVVRVTQEGERVLLQVLDRGPGVPEIDADRIFEPFERAPGVSAPGTGLGLTVVRSVAEAHQGEVWVAPRPGGGSEFTIALPAAG